MAFQSAQALTWQELLNASGQVLGASTIMQVQTAGNTTSGGTSVSVSLAATSVGDLLVVGVNSSNGLPTSVADNKSDSFTLASSLSVSSNRFAVYYAKNIAAGATSVTVAAPYGGIDVIVSEYSGADTTAPLDQSQKYDNGYNSGSSFTSGTTATTAQANEVLWGFAGEAQSDIPVWTAGSGFAARKTQGGSFAEDQIVSAAGQYAATGSFTHGSDYEIGALVVTFKAASGGSSSTAPAISSFSASPSSITAGSSATLSWSVSGSPAPALSINNGVGTVSGSSVSVSPTQTTTYILTATNSAGTVTAQTTVTVSSSDTTPPTVSITSPTSGGTVTGTISVIASASDNVGVAGVQFKLDGSNLGSLITVAPYSYSWNTAAASNGSHTLTALASDAAGNQTTTSAVPVTVSNSTPAPTISSFSASPSSINSGSSATLSWSVSGASSLSIDNGVGTLSGSSITVSPSNTTTYTLTATNSSGSVTAQTVVTVTAVQPPPSGNGAPVLFFTDLISGPNTGGENNNGVYVTIYGNNFGSSPTVTVGGGQAIVKIAPTTYLWYQKMVIQLGPPAASGNIVVANSNGTSNGLPFAVRSGNIYFVSTGGSDSNAGSFAAPWKTLPHAVQTAGAGATIYAENGVSATVDDGQGWGAAVLLRGEWCQGTATNQKALIAYPGATVTVGSSGNSPGYGIEGTDFTAGSGACGGNWVIAELNLRGPQPLQTNGPSSYWRIIGNDVSNPQAGGGSGGGSALGVEMSTYTKVLGNNCHDLALASTDRLQQGLYPGTDSNHLEVGWNMVNNAKGRSGIQIHSSPLSSGNGYVMYDISIHDNVVHNIAEEGIIIDTVDPSQGPVSVYNNVVYNTGMDGKGMDGAIYRADSSDYDQSHGVGSGYVDFYNNTVFNYSGGPGFGGSFEVHQGQALIDRLRNNIILSSGSPYFYEESSQTSYHSCTSGDSASVCPNLTGSNNLVYGAGAPTFTNLVTGSVNQDPKLTSTAGGDAHLLAGSPAIDAGTAISGLAMDVSGTLRPQGSGLDIGAYEYLSSYTPPVSNPPVISSFSVSPSSITSGSSATLSWSVSGATLVSINNSVGDVTSLSTKSVSPTQTTTYTLTATNSSGSVTAQTTVTVNPLLPTISNLLGSNTTATTTQISWQTNVVTNGQVFYGTTASYGSSSALLDNSPLTISHSTILTGLSAATTYHFKVTSIDGSSNSTSSPDFTFTTLSLPPPPAPVISSFTASPSGITSGQSSTLSWSTTNATSLSIDNSIGTVTGNSKSVSPTVTTTYTLTATGSGGTATAQTTVTVNNTVVLPTSTPPSIASFTASPSSITAGAAASLSWSVSGTPALPLPLIIISATFLP